METDRLLAEWHLDSARVVGAIENLVKDPVEAPAVIEVPAELERWQRKGSQRLAPSRRACEKNLRSGSARVTRQLLYALAGNRA